MILTRGARTRGAGAGGLLAAALLCAFAGRAGAAEKAGPKPPPPPAAAKTDPKPPPPGDPKPPPPAAKEGDAPASEGSTPIDPVPPKEAEAPPVDELAAAEAAKEGERQLGLALAHSADGDWAGAARAAWMAIVRIAPTDEKHETAELVLAEALRKLGYTQAAAEYYFSVIERRQSPGLLPRALAGLEGLTRQGVVAEEKLHRGVLVEADVANIPLEVRDFLHFQRGMANLRLGDKRWTSYDFGAIRSDTYYGHRARLALAVSLVKDGKLPEAQAIADAILTEKPDRGAESEARLLRARLLFEGGKATEAIAEYRKVRGTRDAPGGRVLLERAWSHYRDGAYHDSMGLLYALGAPAHRDLFLPEQYVLRGLIYQRFCHFRAAKGAVAAFRTRYATAIDQLKLGKEPREVPEVVRAAEERPALAGLVRVRRAIAIERTMLAGKLGSFEEGGLGAHLTQVYGMLEGRSDAQYRLQMERTGHAVAEELLEALEQANLLEYEVGVSIHRRVQDAGGRDYRGARAEDVPLDGEQTYYRFDGEFWTDELPDMRFLIQDRCVE